MLMPLASLGWMENCRIVFFVPFLVSFEYKSIKLFFPQAEIIYKYQWVIIPQKRGILNALKFKQGLLFLINLKEREGNFDNGKTQ